MSHHLICNPRMFVAVVAVGKWESRRDFQAREASVFSTAFSPAAAHLWGLAGFDFLLCFPIRCPSPSPTGGTATSLRSHPALAAQQFAPSPAAPASPSRSFEYR